MASEVLAGHGRRGARAGKHRLPLTDGVFPTAWDLLARHGRTDDLDGVELDPASTATQSSTPRARPPRRRPTTATP